MSGRRAYLPLAIAISALAVVLWLGRGLDPGWRLIAAAGCGYVLFKSAAVVGPQRAEFLALTGRARIFFSLPWPGFDAKRFTKRGGDMPTRDRLAGGALRMTAGGLAVVLASLNHESWGDAASWVGIGGILLLVHLGYAYVLTWLAQRAGYPVRPLFDDPWKSGSLGEFWTERWNAPFVEMDRILFLPPLRWWLKPRVAAFGVFLISGVLHEMAISYPAGSGFGLPMAYFGIHATAVYAERTVLKLKTWPVAAARTWTIALVFLPLPLLFHHAFRTQLVFPLLQAIAEVLR